MALLAEVQMKIGLSVFDDERQIEQAIDKDKYSFE